MQTGPAASICGTTCTPSPSFCASQPAADSTVLRNVGVGFGHSILAYQSTLRGIRCGAEGPWFV